MNVYVYLQETEAGSWKLKQYLQELPVVGFNTGKYDVNIIYSIGEQSQDQVFRETGYSHTSG